MQSTLAAGDDREVLRHAAQLRDWGTKDAGVLIAGAGAARRQGQFEEAIAWLEQVSAEAPERLEAEAEIGVAEIDLVDGRVTFNGRDLAPAEAQALSAACQEYLRSPPGQ